MQKQAHGVDVGHKREHTYTSPSSIKLIVHHEFEQVHPLLGNESLLIKKILIRSIEKTEEMYPCVREFSQMVPSATPYALVCDFA
jgi:hypothetical protein